jgi:hypothetical protein
MDSLSTDPKQQPVVPATDPTADTSQPAQSLSMNLLQHTDSASSLADTPSAPPSTVAPIGNPVAMNHDDSKVEMVPSGPPAPILSNVPLNSTPPTPPPPPVVPTTSEFTPPKPRPAIAQTVPPEHAPEVLATAPTPPPVRKKRSPLIWIVPLVVLVLLGLGGGWYYYQHRNSSTPPATGAAPTPVVAVSTSPTASAAPSATPTPTATPAATATAPTLSVGGSAIAANGTATVTSNTPTLSGTADPNATIAITVKPAGTTLSATADASGNWSVTPTTDIPNGSNTLAVVSTVNGATAETDFTLVVNAAATSGSTLGETGDPVALIDLAAAIIFLGAIYGLYRTRPKHR